MSLPNDEARFLAFGVTLTLAALLLCELGEHFRWIVGGSFLFQAASKHLGDVGVKDPPFTKTPGDQLDASSFGTTTARAGDGGRPEAHAPTTTSAKTAAGAGDGSAATVARAGDGGRPDADAAATTSVAAAFRSGDRSVNIREFGWTFHGWSRLGNASLNAAHTSTEASESSANSSGVLDALRMVLFISTTRSDQHTSFLECQADLMSRLPMLSRADAVLSVLVDKRSVVGAVEPLVDVSQQLRQKYEQLLAPWSTGTKRVYFLEDPGGDQGAKKAVHVAFSSGWFSSYDWVIRMEPDVVIYNENYLISLMGMPDNWGIFASCNLNPCMHKLRPICCHQRSGCGLQDDFRTNADFYAVRPDRIPRDAFNHWDGKVGEEVEHFISRAFRSIYEAKKEVYIWQDNNDYACRTRGSGVWHTSEVCPVLLHAWQLETPPWHTGFCDQEFPTSSRKLFMEACWNGEELDEEMSARWSQIVNFTSGMSAVSLETGITSLLRVVLFVTTVGSKQHLAFLSCQAGLFSRLPRLSNADAILSVGLPKLSAGEGTAPPKEVRRYEQLVRDWPCRRKTVRFIKNLGYQAGAVEATHIAFSSGWFDGYDWVIRMNPDVVIYNENPLFDFMERPDNWGVFAGCNPGEPCRQHSGCGLKRKGFWTHTDFNAVRPDRLPRDAFNVSGKKVHAESHATMAFQDIFSARTDAYIWNQDVDHNCRIRGGGVWHTQEACPALVNAWERKTPPWYRSFCFEEVPAASGTLFKEACAGHALGQRVKQQEIFVQGGGIMPS